MNLNLDCSHVTLFTFWEICDENTVRCEGDEHLKMQEATPPPSRFTRLASLLRSPSIAALNQSLTSEDDSADDIKRPVFESSFMQEEESQSQPRAALARTASSNELKFESPSAQNRKQHLHSASVSSPSVLSKSTMHKHNRSEDVPSLERWVHFI